MSEASPQTSALSQQELDDFTSKLVTALKTVYDPEIPSDADRTLGSHRVNYRGFPQPVLLPLAFKIMKMFGIAPE